MLRKLLDKLRVPLGRLALVFFVLATKTCWACHTPPQEQMMSADEQIILASDVSIARVVRATPRIDGKTEYEFIVQQRILGRMRCFSR